MARSSINLIQKARKIAAERTAKQIEECLRRLWLEHDVKVTFIEVDAKLKVNFGWESK